MSNIKHDQEMGFSKELFSVTEKYVISNTENCRFAHIELFLGCKMSISQACVLLVLLVRMRTVKEHK